MKKTHSLLLAVVTLLSACTTYQYIPPTSDAGRQCVATCDISQQTCESGEKQTAANRESACETRESNNLAICLASAKDQGAKEKCNRSKKSCYNAPALYRCQESHRTCFTNCGGKVIETN